MHFQKKQKRPNLPPVGALVGVGDGAALGIGDGASVKIGIGGQSHKISTWFSWKHGEKQYNIKNTEEYSTLREQQTKRGPALKHAVCAGEMSLRNLNISYGAGDRWWRFSQKRDCPQNVDLIFLPVKHEGHFEIDWHENTIRQRARHTNHQA